MAIITLDYETAYRSKANKGTEGPNYSLKHWTYEEYLRGTRFTKTHGLIKVPFKAHGAAIKINRESTYWVAHSDLQKHLKELLPENNDHTVICHNAMFDGAIMAWIHGVMAAKYYCTQGMSRALWNQHSASLDDLAKRLFPDEAKKHKDKEALSIADGFWDLTPKQENILSAYSIQDVDVTFNCFEAMWNLGFPPEELEVLDLTLKMFIKRPFVLNSDRVKAYESRLKRNRQRWIKISGWAESTLASNDKFVAKLEKDHGIVIDKVPSPTEKNPENERYPLAKDDIEFLELQDKHPELKAIWKARLAIKSTTEVSRCARMLNHGQVSSINPNGNIAMPLNYCAAHTGRWGGTNRQNPQNMGRGSKLRLALEAPKGHKVIVRDLSNIEGRVNAWFCDQNDVLEMFSDGIDLYNDMGEKIYNKPINHKDPSQAVEGFVSKTACLGLGYGMGYRTFHKTLYTGAMGMRVDLGEEKCRHVVATYRQVNYMIAQMWKRLNSVIADMADPAIEPYMLGPVRIEYRRIVLPNGLALNYPGLRPINHPDAYLDFEYWEGKFWKRLYGPLLLENIIQALSRILMSTAMVRYQDWLDDRDAGMIALTVHDEVVSVVKDEFSEEAFTQKDIEMCKLPDWTDSRLTLKTDGGIDTCYSK